MSISTELSSDLAEAMLAENKGADPARAKELAAILAVVHSSLRHLTAVERNKRRRFVRNMPVPRNTAASPTAD